MKVDCGKSTFTSKQVMKLILAKIKMASRNSISSIKYLLEDYDVKSIEVIRSKNETTISIKVPVKNLT